MKKSIVLGLTNLNFERGGGGDMLGGYWIMANLKMCEVQWIPTENYAPPCLPVHVEPNVAKTYQTSLKITSSN